MKNFLSCACGGQWRDEGYLILRVVTGLAFFYTNVGIPFAGLFAYLVSYGELLGGLALMLGFLTHWVAKINILIMLGAIGFVHWGTEGGWFNGYGADGGYEYQLLLLASSIFFMVTGSGKYSLDARCNKDACPVV